MFLGPSFPCRQVIDPGLTEESIFIQLFLTAFSLKSISLSSLRPDYVQASRMTPATAVTVPEMARGVGRSPSRK